MPTSITGVRSVVPGGFEVGTPGRQPAAFLDRDGVFNSTGSFVNTPADLRNQFYPGAAEAIARLSRESDMEIVVLTNAAGVDNGVMTPQMNLAIQRELVLLIAEAGGRIDAIFYAPATWRYEPPEGEVAARKPEPGLFFAAAQVFGREVDLADSYMVGDMTTDIGAARAANASMKTILVRTGFGGQDGRSDATPDVVVDDIGAAVDWILAAERDAGTAQGSSVDEPGDPVE